ncbi:hypothetical protein AB0H88_25750 [Nonomuraea sp. NPDC050680]|uniref:hypothetical protein n=1 Tax=Nonomuraea sp. NPDC050680 TaxID=3154630 RepID=UPI0033C57D5E
MRRLLAGTLSAALLTVPLAPAQAADLRIGNGGFDDGLTGWSGSHSPGGVTAVTWDGRSTARVADAEPGNAYGRESQPGLPATAGTRYTAGTGVYDPLRGDVDDGSPDTPTRTGLSQTDSVLNSLWFPEGIRQLRQAWPGLGRSRAR